MPSPPAREGSKASAEICSEPQQGHAPLHLS